MPAVSAESPTQIASDSQQGLTLEAAITQLQQFLEFYNQVANNNWIVPSLNGLTFTTVFNAADQAAMAAQLTALKSNITGTIASL